MTFTHRSKAAALCAMVLWLGACGSDGGSDSEFGFATGPLMKPGQACSQCHGKQSQYETAPRFSLGGTVYASADAAADGGVPGVSVIISDAAGSELQTLTTNEVGNFYTVATLPDGYRVALEYEGERIEMPCSPPSGGCANCHSAQPAGHATGRLYIPQGQTGELKAFDCGAWQPL